jgi:hypothetical protein
MSQVSFSLVVLCHPTSTSSARRPATDTTLPPLLCLRQTFFSIPIIYYFNLRERSRLLEDFSEFAILRAHSAYRYDTKLYFTTRLLGSRLPGVVKLHYRKVCFDPIIAYRSAKPSSNLLSIKDTFTTDRLALIEHTSPAHLEYT